MATGSNTPTKWVKDKKVFEGRKRGIHEKSKVNLKVKVESMNSESELESFGRTKKGSMKSES